MKSERIALIPAYEPDGQLPTLAEALAAEGFRVLIVDDGSGPAYAEVFAGCGERATVLRHEKNLGKGAALKTGLAWIRDHGPESCTVVTADADGQHLPQDVLRICQVAELEPEALVLGGRRFAGQVPLRSRLGNGLTRWVFRLSTGVRVYDTQTGLRAFSKALLPELLEIPGQRYEYEMNMLLALARGGKPIRELPIQTVYLEGNRSSHFHPLRDSARIYGEILKFSAASLAGFLLDYSLFTLLSVLSGSVVFSNLAARLVSGVVNYSLNRKLVFQSKAGLARSGLQYALLALGILGVNTLALWVLVTLLGWNRYLAKLLVELLLFTVSYVVQKRWIFHRKEAAA